MRHRSSKQAKQKIFSGKTKEEVMERDRGCIFCLSGRWPGGDEFEKNVFDIAHVIGRGKGGLGIATNGVVGCRYHHGLMDNGNKGLRRELLAYAKEYLKERYPDWSEGQQVYRKYNF